MHQRSENEKARDPVKIIVPSKRIRDASPKEIRRVAFVDNAFHLYWLLPPGAGANQAQDPLKRRDGTPPVYDAVLEDGSKSQIEIGTFVHFDIRLGRGLHFRHLLWFRPQQAKIVGPKGRYRGQGRIQRVRQRAEPFGNGRQKRHRLQLGRQGREQAADAGHRHRPQVS